MFNFTRYESQVRQTLASRLNELDHIIAKSEADSARMAGLPLPYPDFVAWVLEATTLRLRSFPRASIKSFSAPVR